MEKAISSKMKYINIIIVLFLIFGFRYIPPFSTLTPTGMHVLGIFLGVVYGWSTVDLIWPGFFAIISMSFVEGFDLTSIIASGFGSSTFWIILFMLMFVMVFERAGGTQFVATWFITRKFLHGKPVLFNFMFLFAAFLIGMLNGIAACLLFYTILYKICEQVGYKKHTKYPVFMIFGITFMAMFGSVSHSLLGSPLILANAFRAASGIDLTLIDFIKVCWLFSVFLNLVYCLALKFIFRCDLEPLANVDIETVVNMDALKVTPQLKVMFFLVIVLVLGIAGGAMLPAEWTLTQILNQLGLLGISMILLGIMTYWKVEDHYLFDFRKYANTIQWDCLFICAVVMPMSGMLTMEGTGINLFISSILGDALASLPPLAFVAAVLFLGMILTNFGNNVSICVLLMPVIINVCGTTGLDPAPIYMCMIFAVHLAMLTPGACPYAALVWGNTEWISAKEIYKYVPMIMMLFYICIVLVGYNWAKFMLN